MYSSSQFDHETCMSVALWVIIALDNYLQPWLQINQSRYVTGIVTTFESLHIKSKCSQISKFLRLSQRQVQRFKLKRLFVLVCQWTAQWNQKQKNMQHQTANNPDRWTGPSYFCQKSSHAPQLKISEPVQPQNQADFIRPVSNWTVFIIVSFLYYFTQPYNLICAHIQKLQLITY